MSEIRFDFELEATHGWAIATLTIGAASVRRSASYISDGLGAFIGVINDLVGYDMPHLGMIRWCTWEDEPGGTLLEFELLADQTVEVRAYELDDSSEGRRLAQVSRYDQKKAERLIFTEPCALLELGRAVAASAERALLGWGLEKWRVRWGHEFPIGVYFELKQGIAALAGEPARPMTLAAEIEALRAVVEGPEMPSRPA